MKKVMIVLVICMISLGGFTQKIKFNVGFEVSLQNEHVKVGDTWEKVDPLRTNVQARMECGSIMFISDNEFFMRVDGRYFNPSQAIFNMRIEYSKNKVTVGVKHRCFHPVITPGIETHGFYGGGDRFYIKYNIL